MSLVDEYGNETGEVTPIYGEPKLMRANISWATGRANTEQFGINLDYDRVIVTDDKSCPIDETTVLFVEKEPEFKVVTHIVDGEPVEIQYPLFDYIVKRVSPSIHYISIAIKRVDVT